MPLVALCADEECFRHPELLGLEGENLLAQQWLMPFTSAEQARAALRDAASVQEVWVVSCADVAPINLAAALKRDRPGRRVCMLTAQESGSLRSRTTAAGVDASLTRQAFVERYAQCKQVAMRAIELQAGIGSGAVCAPAGEAPQQQATFGVASSMASPYGVAATHSAGFSEALERAGTAAGRRHRLRRCGRADRMRRRTPSWLLPLHRPQWTLLRPFPPMGPYRGWGLLEAPRLQRRTRSTRRRRAFCCRW